MDDLVFHAGFAVVYTTMAIEAWRLKHHRLAFGYCVLAFLSLSFAALHLPWASSTAALWA
jgi:hypothetical protein